MNMIKEQVLLDLSFILSFAVILESSAVLLSVKQETSTAGNEEKAKLFLPVAKTHQVLHFLPTSCQASKSFSQLLWSV